MMKEFLFYLLTFYYFIYYHVLCVCVCVCVRACDGMYMEVRRHLVGVGFLPSPCGFWRLISDHEAW